MGVASYPNPREMIVLDKADRQRGMARYGLADDLPKDPDALRRFDRVINAMLALS